MVHVEFEALTLKSLLASFCIRSITILVFSNILVTYHMVYIYVFVYSFIKMLLYCFVFYCYPATPYYVRPDPPRFIQQPQSMTLLPGYPATLTCAINTQSIISGYNTVEMHWEFNGNIVKNPELLSNVVLSDVTSGQLTLMFQHLNESNTGRYRCVMQDGLFTIVSEVAELSLYGKTKYAIIKGEFCHECTYITFCMICIYTIARIMPVWHFSFFQFKNKRTPLLIFVYYFYKL